MKLEISLDANDTCDLVDTVFVKLNKKLIKACDVLLKYHVYGYGEES